ncbi:hypothetical protein D3C87_105080 [compost metagenome]
MPPKPTLISFSEQKSVHSLDTQQLRPKNKKESQDLRREGLYEGHSKGNEVRTLEARMIEEEGLPLVRGLRGGWKPLAARGGKATRQGGRAPHKREAFFLGQSARVPF